MKRSIFSYTAKQLTPYIDWAYFYHAWGIGAQDTQGDKAREVRYDAEKLLADIADEEVADAVFALCEAKSDEDNIIIENTTLPLLRQQHARADEPCLCLSDFVSPQSDKIGLFATTARCNPLAESDDTYKNILAQTIATRLAEAAATLLHKNVRREKNLWGYSPEEALTPEELNAEKYQGIRPAVGYPSLPDQTIIFIIDKFLRLQDIGITLTPNGAMHPHASTCGLMFSHPASRYFSVGRISREQLHDYATRRGIAAADLHKFLYKNLPKELF